MIHRRIMQWLWMTVVVIVFLGCSDLVFVMVDATAVHVPLGADKGHRPRIGSSVAPCVASLHNKSWLSSTRGGAVASKFVDNLSKIRRFTDPTGGDRMPCLFSQEEEIYDRYAACLAATEGLRRIRDRDITEQQESIMASRKASAGSSSLVPDSVKLQAVAEAKHRITTKYVQQSMKVLRALGMTVSQFNELGRDIAKDDKLKEKVMEQAYLYRMAATVNMDRSHFLEDTTTSVASSSSKSSSSSSSSKSPSSPSPKDGGFQRDKVALFCRSMSEIEKLRAGQIERLKQYLHVEQFPEHVNISDPTLLPFLSPKVRAVVEAFPLQAEAIVKRQGLGSDEFNEMLHATKSNPIFRWKIQKVMRDTVDLSSDNPISRNKQRPTNGPPATTVKSMPRNPSPPVVPATAF